MAKIFKRTLTYAGLLANLLAACGGTPTVPPAPLPVYQADPDYEALTRPESPWYGTLAAAANSYTLAFGDEEQALFIEDVEAQVEPFVGRAVVVTGKLASDEEDAPLWPAKVALHADGLLACGTLLPRKPAAEKIAPYLADLIAEQPGERIERVSVSFCDDQTVTPDSTREQLERLRASAYAMLKRELRPLAVEVEETSWLTQSLAVKIELRRALTIAERADVLSVDSLTQITPPPSATSHR